MCLYYMSFILRSLSLFHLCLQGEGKSPLYPLA